MKYKAFFSCAAIVFFASCSNGEGYNQHSDSANMLQDTLPATHNPPVAIPLDSNPPDATHVDSMKNMTR